MAKLNVKDPYKAARRIIEDPKDGWLAFYSCGLMLGWIGLLFWGVLSVANYIDPRVYDTLFQSRSHVAKIGIPMVLLIYFLFWLLVEKGDKYLVYFQQFEQRDKQVKRKDAIIATSIIGGGFLFYVFSLFLI